MKRLRRIIFGEKLPDVNEPRYRAMYERDKSAGRRFASFLRLDVLMCHIQNFADRHKRLFLAIVFSIVFVVLTLTTARLVWCFSHSDTISAVAQQEQIINNVLKDRSN